MSLLLQLQHPLGQLLRRQIETFALVRDVVVLTEDATQVAAAEENAAGAIVACDARLFAKVRSDDIYLHIGTNEAVASFLVAIDGAETRAEVAVAQVGVGEGAFAGGVDGGEEVVAGDVIVKEEWWCKVEVAVGLDGAQQACVSLEGRSQSGYRPSPGG